jgi:hypothetical protein
MVMGDLEIKTVFFEWTFHHVLEKLYEEDENHR